jgi:hypothetical protein
MRSVSYITLITRLLAGSAALGALLGLSACGGVPITKTNCWSSAGSTVTTSTKGTSPAHLPASRAEATAPDAISCQ